MSGLIDNIGVLVASFSAVYGITQWRRELRDRKKYEIAELVLTLSYECRDRIRVIRSPLIGAGEGRSRERNSSETEIESEFLDRAYVVFERYEANRAPINELFSVRYRFMALFGEDAAAPIRKLREALNEIFVSANALPSYWRRQGGNFSSDDAFEKHLEEMHGHEAIFWGTFSERDHFNKKIEQLVAEIESSCAYVIRPRSFRQKISRLFYSNS